MITSTASAPGKLLLLGDHAVVHGRPCIVTAVDQRVRVSVQKNGAQVFHLNAPDMGLTSYSKKIRELGQKELPKSVAFVEMCYKRFLEKFPQREGVVVTTKSDFSSLFGFGSSSAVTVAFAKSLSHLYDIKLTNNELFQLCYQAVLDVQGIGSGFDIAAAIWGGTIYYTKPAKTVAPIDCADIPIIVGYTGVKADTPTLVRMVERLLQENPKQVSNIFDQISNIVDTGAQTLLDKNWEKLGQLMNQNHALLRQLQVSGIQLEKLVNSCIAAGAHGAKLSGAGGGDCMIAIAPTRSQDVVRQSIQQAGGTVMNVGLHANGVTIE